MCNDTTNKTISKENPIKKGEESLKKKAKTKIIAHNFSRKLAEKNPESKLIKAYEESYFCSIHIRWGVEKPIHTIVIDHFVLFASVFRLRRI